MKRLVLLIWILLLATSAYAGKPGVIQTASGSDNTASTSFNVTLNNVRSASAIVVAYSWATNVTASVTSDVNGAFTSMRKHSVSTTDHLEVFYLLNTTAGTHVVTIATTGSGGTFRRWHVHEVGGIATSSAEDGENSATGTSTTASPGSITTSAADTWVFGAVSSFSSVTYTPATGYYLRVSALSSGDTAGEDRILPSAGSTTPSVTQSSSVQFLAVGIGLKANTGDVAPIAAYAGAQVAVTTGTCTAVIPAGFETDDLGVLVVAGRPTDATDASNPSGWTTDASSLQEVGAVDLKIQTFYRKLVSSDSNPAVTVPASWDGGTAGMSCQILVIRNAHLTTPIDATSVTSGSTAADQWQPTGITTATDNALVISAVATADDNALTVVTAQTFITLMSGANYDTSSGGDHAVGVASAHRATAGAPTMLTWDQTAVGTDQWAGITMAIKAAAGGSPPPTTRGDFMMMGVGGP